MKITLIYPGIAMLGFDSLGHSCHDAISLNLGLGYIASYLKKHSSHSVDLLDLRDLKNWDHYENELRTRKPDIVGIYCNTVNHTNSLKAAETAKKLGKIVITGGPHATLDPNSLLDSNCVDCVVVGEGEISFLKIVDSIESGKKIDKIIQGEKINNLDEIPFPDRDLYNMPRILNGPGIFPHPSRYVGILASRGCYYNCSFCQPLEKKLFGKIVRTRSIENIIAEVKEVIEKYDANFIMFECDTLTTKKSFLLELCSEMEKIGVKWGAQSRSDTLDDEMGKAMHKAGCMVVFIGFESGSQRILDLLRKGITPEQSINAARICRKNKLLIFANYMLGMPGETVDDLEMTREMIKTIMPEIHSPAYYSPIPGSDLYDYCYENDLIKVTSYEGFVRNPVNEKISGIDIKTLNFYRETITRYQREWWTELHFAKHTLSRWLFLLSKGYLRTLLGELTNQTFPLRKIAGIMFKIIKPEPKDLT